MWKLATSILTVAALVPIGASAVAQQERRITDVEWNSIGVLTATVVVPEPTTSPLGIQVQCAAAVNGVPIGSGMSFSQAGVARVPIDTPQKYRGRADVVAHCF